MVPDRPAAPAALLTRQLAVEAIALACLQALVEMGDLLCTIANLARKRGIEPESALRMANDKFTRRFDALEAWFEARGRSVHSAALEEMEAAWGEVKKKAQGSGAQGSKAQGPKAQRLKG